MQRADGGEETRLFFECPGCDDVHAVQVVPPTWGWDGDLERPTVTPSVLVQGGSQGIVCHSFVTDGRIQYLADSTHALAGQTVDLPEWSNRIGAHR